MARPNGVVPHEAIIMTLSIQPHNGQAFAVPVCLRCRVWKLIVFITRICVIHPLHLFFFYNGRLLIPSQTLGNYNLRDNDTIDLVIVNWPLNPTGRIGGHINRPLLYSYPPPPEIGPGHEPLYPRALYPPPPFPAAAAPHPGFHGCPLCPPLPHPATATPPPRFRGGPPYPNHPYSATAAAPPPGFRGHHPNQHLYPTAAAAPPPQFHGYLNLPPNPALANPIPVLEYNPNPVLEYVFIDPYLEHNPNPVLEYNPNPILLYNPNPVLEGNHAPAPVLEDHNPIPVGDSPSPDSVGDNQTPVTGGGRPRKRRRMEGGVSGDQS